MKKKYIIGAVILLIPIIFLTYMGIKSSLTYYYEVDELLAKGTTIVDKNVKVGGEVLPGVETDASKFEARFSLIDIESRQGTIDVVYKGALPDTFQVERDVIVEGKYTAAGIFEAKSIITKCSSKYVPEGVKTETEK